jgi:UDP-GlcNAc:undecaprenyl-phosphate GlcNAc-1-phosphate transferase
VSSPEPIRLGLAFGASLVVSALLTPLARSLARRAGFVAKPKEDRWHRAPTALLGGPAIVLGSIFAFLAVYGLSQPRVVKAWIAGALLIALVGLFDDLRNLRPTTKLIAQIVAALLPLQAGVDIPGLHPLLSFWVALFWIVGITNAFNLLDNMDGLAAGIAAVAAAFVVLHGTTSGSPAVAIAAATICGASIGFLFYNFQPASIFMGDSGSLFLGYSLATLSLIDLRTRPLVSLSIISIPVLVLAIPIFDTTLVTVLRLLHGRSPAQGGRDHSSHRLVSLGLSERRAVLILYSLAALAGASSLLVPRVRASMVTLVFLGVTLAIYYFGAYLGKVKVYKGDPDALEWARSRGLFILDTFVAHKQQIVDVLLDVAIVAVSCLSAYLLRYEGVLSDLNLGLILQSLPILLALRLAAFFAFGLYRAVPGSFSIHDFLSIGKAVLISSAAFVTGLVFFVRFADYSRTVILLDAILTGALITFSRIAFRSLDVIVRDLAGPGGKRVLVVGAGALGEAAIRLLRSDKSNRYQVVGFLDDSRDKVGRRLHGLPVLGTLSEADRVLAEQEVAQVVIAISTLAPVKRAHLENACHRQSIETRSIQLQ